MKNQTRSVLSQQVMGAHGASQSPNPLDIFTFQLEQRPQVANVCVARLLGFGCARATLSSAQPLRKDAL